MNVAICAALTLLIPSNPTRADDTSLPSPPDTALHLRIGTFDPAVGWPPIPRPLQPSNDSHLVLVQFDRPPRTADRSAIEALGATVLKYVPASAFVIRLDPAKLEALRALKGVRWAGRFPPAARLDEDLLAALSATGAKRSSGELVLSPAPYHVMCFERGPGAQQRVAARISALGGRVEQLTPEGFRLRATLDSAQLLAVSRLDDVQFIDRATPPEPDMDIVRAVGGANYIQALFAFRGAGITGEVLDDNMRNSHVDFQNIPVLFHTAHSGDTSHGTSVYGILFGSGSGDPQATGMLPEGRGIFADYDQVSNRYAHTAELLHPPYNALFQSNSWGHARTIDYTSDSAELDDIAHRLDILIIQSQSNGGNQLSRPEAWCKNVVSVGGLFHYNNTNFTDDCWCFGASTGPAADGRIKPDLAHFYDAIWTTFSTNDLSYVNFAQTSASTPIVAGHFGIFYELWREGIFGNPPGEDAFAARPHAATAKAVLINTATPWSFSGSTSDRTRTHQGWGIPDLRSLFQRSGRMFVIDGTRILSEQQTARYTLLVPAGEASFRATMVYADPPAAPAATIHRVNDLTLRVSAPGGTFYYGNNGLLTGLWSTPGGLPNTRDTVENVFVASPEPGLWTVEVIAAEINEDAHLATPGLDADFALVVSGVLPSACPAVRGDVNCDGALDNSDIDAFVLALLDPAGYGTAYPGCYRACAADINGDGAVDNADIDPFVNCLLGGPCP